MKSAKKTPPSFLVAVLVLDEANMLSLAAAIDPLRAANRLSGQRLFDWSYVTATGRPARLTGGLDVPGPALSRLDHCDAVVVVAGFALERQARPALLAGLRRLARRGATLAGIDGGPWILAEAGLLDGYSATTHWEDLDRFATRFPGVTVVRDRYRLDRDRMTSGGAMPAIDMMLSLVRTLHGDALAARVAGVFIHDAATDPARAQSRAGAHAGHNAATARANALMEHALDTPLPIPDIARRAGISPRSLEVQFRYRLKTTPQAHYLNLRLSEAHRLVTDTEMPLMDVALATGFASPSSFARAFRKAHGVSARSLRATRGSDRANDET